MKSWSPYILTPAAALMISVPAGAITYLSVKEAKKVCFPNANRFEETHIMFSDAQIKTIENLTGQKIRTRGQQVWKAWNEDILLGFFIIDYVIGKHEVIDYAIALDDQGQVHQIEILTYRESYGWEIRNKNWRKQFIGKTSHSPLELHEDIVNIGGATLSCRNVTQGIKKVLTIYETILKNS